MCVNQCKVLGTCNVYIQKALKQLVGIKESHMSELERLKSIDPIPELKEVKVASIRRSSNKYCLYDYCVQSEESLNKLKALIEKTLGKVNKLKPIVEYVCDVTSLELELKRLSKPQQNDSFEVISKKMNEIFEFKEKLDCESNNQLDCIVQLLKTEKALRDSKNNWKGFYEHFEPKINVSFCGAKLNSFNRLSVNYHNCTNYPCLK